MDDDQPSLDVPRVDEGVGVGFETFAPLKGSRGGAAGLVVGRPQGGVCAGGRARPGAADEICDARHHLPCPPPKRKTSLVRHRASIWAFVRAPSALSLTVIGGHVRVGLKISCLPRLANSEPSSLKADDSVRVSRRKSRR